MKDNFNIVKFLSKKTLLKESIGGYVDLKPIGSLKETFGDEWDPANPVDNSEKFIDAGDNSGEEQLGGRLESLISKRDISVIRASAQRIFDDLTADGFEAEEVAEYLMDQITQAGAPYMRSRGI